MDQHGVIELIFRVLHFQEAAMLFGGSKGFIIAHLILSYRYPNITATAYPIQLELQQIQISQFQMASYFFKDQKSKSKAKQETAKKIRQIPNLLSPERLSKMNYSNNEIRAIPSHISAAVNLQIIDLSHNRISKIDPLCQVISLRYIDVGYNSISQIPTNIVALRQLTHLNLSFNKLAILSSIKPIKLLIEERVLHWNGSIQVNFDGNQVIRKKNCRDIIRKWSNPNLKQYTQNKALTKSNVCQFNRVSKSLDSSKPKDISMVDTHRTISVSVSNQGNSQQMNQMTEIKHKSMAQHKYNEQSKISPHFDQYSPSIMQIAQSQMLQPPIQPFQHTGKEEKLHQMLAEFNTLNKNFTLIFSSSDLNTLPSDLQQMIREEIQLGEEMLKSLKQLIQKRLKGMFQDGGNVLDLHLNQKIKEIHVKVLQIFAEKKDLSLNLYKPWVSQYRKLKQIISQLPLLLQAHQEAALRAKQISQLMDISPEKGHEPNTNKKEKDRDIEQKLQELLFSKKKESNLLDSEKKNSIHKNRDQQECDQCILKKYQIQKLSHQLQIQYQTGERLQNENQQYIKKLQQVNSNAKMYEQMLQKQQLIIQQLKKKIQPSTYQSILLQQAHAVQKLLKMDHYLKNTKNSWQFNQIINNGRKLTTEKGSSNKKSIKSGKNSSNQLTERESFKHNATKKVKQASSSYFKHKNTIATFDRNGQAFQSTGGARQKQIDERQIIVSQFNSHMNSVNNSNQSKKKESGGHFSKHKNKDKDISQHQQNRIKSIPDDRSLLITQSSKKKDLSKSSLNQFKTQDYAKAIRSQFESHHSQSIKQNVPPNTAYRKSFKNQSHLRADSVDCLVNYKKCDYKDADHLREEDRYKDYVQHHLRNNIIRILSKKQISIDPDLETRKYHVLVSNKQCKNLIQKQKGNSTERFLQMKINKVY